MSGDSSGGSGGERAPSIEAALGAFAASAEDLTGLLDCIALHAARSLGATVDIAALRAGARLDSSHFIRRSSPCAVSWFVDELLSEQPMLKADLEAGRPRLVGPIAPELALAGCSGPVALWPLRCASRVVGLLTALRPTDAGALTEDELRAGEPLAAAAALALGYALLLGDAGERASSPRGLDDRIGPVELGPAATSRGRLSHELRTPLNVIIGFSSLLHAGKAGPLSEPQREYVGDILTSSKRLLELVNRVLEEASGAVPPGAAELPDGR